MSFFFAILPFFPSFLGAEAHFFFVFLLAGAICFLAVEGLGKGMRWFGAWEATEEIGESDWFIALASLPQRFANGFVSA